MLAVMDIFFPNVCTVCCNSLTKSESVICLECQFHLPNTGFHLIAENQVAKAFWGKANVFSATAMYFFDKGEKVQKLLHGLKYKGQKETGIKLGKLFGAELLNTDFIKTVDCIIPVPLHAKKIRLRGYNQSEVIAQGMSQILNIPVVSDLLKRQIATATQTRKSRFERWENVDNVFVLNEAESFTGKHVLLLDDVITTGSTIAACAEAFSDVKNCKVSVGAVAFAHS